MSTHIDQIHTSFHKLVQDQDNEIFYQSPNNQIGLFLSLLITTLFTFYSLSEYPWSIDWIDLGVISSTSIRLPIPFFAIVPIFLAAVLVHRLKNYKMVLCHEYVLLIEGLMQWRENSFRIHYKKIQEIGIQQTLLQRAFNVGDVLIISVAGEVSTLRMPGVYNPRKLKDSIEARINVSEHDATE